MARSESEQLRDLVKYINNLDKGDRIVAYMTALLISWKNIDPEQIEEILSKTYKAIDQYMMITSEDATKH